MPPAWVFVAGYTRVRPGDGRLLVRFPSAAAVESGLQGVTYTAIDRLSLRFQRHRLVVIQKRFAHAPELRRRLHAPDVLQKFPATPSR